MMRRLPFLRKYPSLIFTFFFLTHLSLVLGQVSCFSKAGEPSELFPEIRGWKKSADIQVYGPEILYEYINGAAELYLSYDFQELQVAEYLDENEASVLVEIYRHKTPVHAFGIYSRERPTQGNFLNIGAHGYIEVPILNFLTANYYVKISSYNVGAKSKEVLQTFAKKVAENLGGKASLPKVLTCFPNNGKVQNSEKFISKNFLGYEFLHSGFTADYDDVNGTFKLFIIEGADRQDCEEMLRQYMQFTRDSQRNLKEGLYTLSDPYHEDIALFWKGKYIWGVLNLAEANLRSKYLKSIEEHLRKEMLIE
ncbi:hypothetical protein ISS37_03415 [candidate division KSB1 bacterium]|nr:hypothetical protein [candidate division KSB1 bacterium]